MNDIYKLRECLESVTDYCNRHNINLEKYTRIITFYQSANNVKAYIAVLLENVDECHLFFCACHVFIDGEFAYTVKRPNWLFKKSLSLYQLMSAEEYVKRYLPAYEDNEEFKNGSD